MDHMHRNGIFHRDIKPENILIMEDALKVNYITCPTAWTVQLFQYIVQEYITWILQLSSIHQVQLFLHVAADGWEWVCLACGFWKLPRCIFKTAIHRIHFYPLVTPRPISTIHHNLPSLLGGMLHFSYKLQLLLTIHTVFQDSCPFSDCSLSNLKLQKPMQIHCINLAHIKENRQDQSLSWAFSYPTFGLRWQESSLHKEISNSLQTSVNFVPYVGQVPSTRMLVDRWIL